VGKPRPEAPQGPPIVGLVASAGGLEAFGKFLGAVPPDSGLCLVLVPHLDPHRESFMPRVLAPHTPMPVKLVEPDEQLLGNHVYVIPPGHYLEIEHGVARLHGPVERYGPRNVMDSFLRSLALDQQDRAIAVVLSGTGSMGTAGSLAVKTVGGLLLVQDPKTADQPGMPESVISAGLADFVLSPEQMPGALLAYVEQSFWLPAVPAAQNGLASVVALLRARMHFDFRFYRKNVVARRVQQRMGLRRVTSLSHYVDLLHEQPEELAQLAKSLLISVTGFFRDPELFAVLEAQVIPEILRGKPADSNVRIWVPACATGEEAYSIAMIVQERIAASNCSRGLRVFATDIDSRALEIARRGEYSATGAEEVGPERLARFFTRGERGLYRVNPLLRETTLFAPQNLLSDAPFSRMDLISCRNLLIYLEPEVQQKVLGLLHFALNDGGYLVLGSAESLGPAEELFEPVSKKWRIYRRRAGLRRMPYDFPFDRPIERALPHKPRSGDAPLPAGPAELMREALAQEFTEAAVLVRADGKVLFYHGPTEQYLQHAAGEPTADLVALVQQDLRPRVRAAIHRCLRENRRVLLSGGRIKHRGRWVPVTVSARRVQLANPLDGLVLVTFRQEPVQTAAKSAKGGSEDLLRRLDQDLKSTREELEAAVEELQSANEELKTSNEEVMSINEELQSANEELETSKEELQAVNEELSTVNAQLQEKLDALADANNDLINFQTSADTATLFLGVDRTIKRYTAAATRLFRIIPGDVGRPIADIQWRVDDQTLVADVGAVLESLGTAEREARAHDGRWYLRRITPYRTADQRIEGVVVTFVDISALKQAEERQRGLNAELERRVSERTTQLRDERNFISAVLDTVDALIMVLDRAGRVVRFNTACERVSGYRFDEVRDKTIREIGLVPDGEVDAVRQVLNGLVAGGAPVHQHNHWRHRDGTQILIAGSNSCLVDAAGGIEHIVRTGVPAPAAQETAAGAT
jgi:two-component system CheB/CheR fusion protein